MMNESECLTDQLTKYLTGTLSYYNKPIINVKLTKEIHLDKVFPSLFTAFMGDNTDD